jgi:3-phenylpropionate/trans-cinnamate dioxygenase ferredoxin subunit
MTERWVDVGDARTMRRRNRARPIEAARCGILMCNLDGTLYAIADVCTHDGGRLEGGRIRDATVVCPRHGARFDVRDGSVQALPAVRPIASYPVRVLDGRIEVQLPDECIDEAQR